MTEKPRVLDFGLALGGGGAKGLSHIPFLAALDEMNVRPAAISGCSIGAIVGVMYAAGMSAAKIIEMIGNDSLFDGAMRLFSSDVSDGLTASILRIALPVSTFAELAIPTMVVASDYWSREQVLISDGDLATAMAASAALPGMILPVRRDGRTLIDGGCVNPVPFDVLTGKVRHVAAINVAGVKDDSDSAQAPSRTNALFVAFQIMQHSILREKLKASPVDFLAQPGLRNIRVLDFDKADAIMESARDDVARFRVWVSQLAQQSPA